MFNVFDINISYEHLDKLLLNYLNNITYSTNINVIIDLHDVLSKLFKMDIEIEDGSLFIEEMTSNIISIISHYRWYFYNRKKYTTFYFLYTEKIPSIFVEKNKEYCQHFKEKYLSGKYAEYIKQSIKNFKNIAEYIPHVKYINTEKYGSLMYAKQIIDNTTEYNLNIILSNNINYGVLLNKHTIMLNIRNYYTEVLTNSNIIQYLTNNKYNYSNELIPVLLSIIGSTKVSINGISGYGKFKASKIIAESIKSNNLQNVIYFNPPFKDIDYSVIKENLELLNSNYFIFYPIELLFSNQDKIKEEIISLELLVTAEDFYQLNEVIFIHFPLNVQKMLAGEIKY